VPEGDTIRRLADKIHRRFAGHACIECITRDPRLTSADFAGTRLVEADAVGKHLLLRFDDRRTLHAHLRMQGSWVVGRRATETPWRRRIELRFDDGWLTGIDVPVLGVVRTLDESIVTGHLGPNLCGPVAPDVTVVHARALALPDRALAATLLDQRVAAGLGNLYAVEVPFITGVNPHQPVGTIESLGDLISVAVALIRTNAERGPQNTTGRKLSTSDHWIYGRRGRPCPLCGTRLDGLDEASSPWQRVSTWCSSCQPLGPARAVDRARVEKLTALHPARVSLSRVTGR
jgi:endonuclease VIII